MKQDEQSQAIDHQERLFLSLAEQLSQTFLRLARVAETAPSSDELTRLQQWSIVHDVSEAAMLLTESYALNVRLVQHLATPELEPITISSLFYDAAQQLTPLARRYGVELRLADLPRMSPVISDRVVLQSALVSLGQVFVAAQAENEMIQPLHLAAHRSRYGVVGGLYSEQSELSADAFRRAQSLYGTARQPIARMTSGSASGVFIADNLLRAVATKLHVARYHNMTGLATTLPVCNQLQLV